MFANLSPSICAVRRRVTAFPRSPAPTSEGNQSCRNEASAQKTANNKGAAYYSTCSMLKLLNHVKPKSLLSVDIASHGTEAATRVPIPSHLKRLRKDLQWAELKKTAISASTRGTFLFGLLAVSGVFAPGCSKLPANLKPFAETQWLHALFTAPHKAPLPPISKATSRRPARPSNMCKLKLSRSIGSSSLTAT